MLHSPTQIPCRVQRAELEGHAWGEQVEIVVQGASPHSPVLDFEATFTLPVGVPAPALGSAVLVTIDFDEAAVAIATAELTRPAARVEAPA